ncbi:hypothetical protein ABPG73_010171, partial [Tetrahymena malaccensis]
QIKKKQEKKQIKFNNQSQKIFQAMNKDQQQSSLTQDQNKFQLIQNKATQSSLIQTNQNFILVQELEISQNSKQDDWIQNITLNSSDLTLKNSLKSKIVKVARSRTLTNVQYKIINEEKKQTIQMSCQKNRLKPSELDLSCHLYKINQQYQDQQQEECIILSTGSQEFHSGQRSTNQNSQIIIPFQKIDQKNTQIDEFSLIQSQNFEGESENKKKQTENMFDYPDRLAQQKPSQIDNREKTLSSNQISQKTVQNTKQYSESQKEIKKEQDSFKNNKNQQDDNKLIQKKEEDIQKQENGIFISQSITNQIQEKIKDKDFDNFYQQQDQKDVQEQNKIQQQIDSKESDIVQYDPMDKYLQEKQKKYLEDKENDKQNNNCQQDISHQILIDLSQKNYQHIFDEIQAYQFIEYGQQDQTEDQSQVGHFIERKFNEDTFKIINKSFIKNKLFEEMENKIFKVLQERNYYICKLLNQNEKQDLFIGYEELGQFQYDDELIQIKYNMTQSELKITELMFDALQLEYQKIDIQSHNTYAFILSKKDIENLQAKLTIFNLALNDALNFSEFQNHSEITLKNTNKQIKIQKYEKQIDFLFSFLKDQKYYQCEFNVKQIEGIMLDADLQQIIQLLQDFLIQQIFNQSLKDDDFAQQNFRKSKGIIKEKEAISDKAQTRLENINQQEIIHNQDTIQEHMSNLNLSETQFEKKSTKIENLENLQSTENQNKNVILTNPANEQKEINQEEGIQKQNDSSQLNNDSLNQTLNMQFDHINCYQYHQKISNRFIKILVEVLSEFPILLLTLSSIDSWGRNTLQGTYCEVPRKQGYQEITIKAWSSAQSIYQKIHVFFLGGQTKLNDIKKTAQISVLNDQYTQSAIDRFNLTTESKGAVKLTFNAALQSKKSKEEKTAIYNAKRLNLKKQQQKLIDPSEIDQQGQKKNSSAPVIKQLGVVFQNKISFCFSSSSRGFLRSGIGYSIDNIPEYVDKTIQDQQVIDNLQNLTDKYFVAISKNDKQSIQQLAKKSLCEKTNQWIDEVSKKGESFQLIGTDNQSVSLQCFTSYSYIYGLANNQDNKKFESYSIFNLNKNFLVKRMLFIDGFKAHQIFSQKSILVEAFVYNTLRLSIKKDSKQQQNQQNLQYAGYKICFVCDGKYEQQVPYILLDNDKKQLYKQEDKQKYFEQNCWKIADINDWIYGDLQQQDFKKWAFQAVKDQQSDQIADLKSSQTK